MAVSISSATVSSNGISITGSQFADRLETVSYNAQSGLTISAGRVRPTNDNSTTYYKDGNTTRFFKATAQISGVNLNFDPTTLVGGVMETDVEITAGSVVFSDDTNTPALTLDFPCTLTNYGYILGKGGDGGSFTNGYNGGTALKLNASDTTVINYGWIAGGGGGGGSSTSGRSRGGGGGGAGGGNGGNGNSYPGGIGGAINAAGSNPATIMVRNDGTSYNAEGKGGGAGGGGSGAYSSIHGGGGGGGRLLSNPYGGAGGAYYGGAGGAYGNVGGNEGGNNDYRGGGGGGGWGATGGSAVGYAGLPGGLGGPAIQASFTYTLSNSATIYGTV